jgi:hypothetical protein
VNGLIIIILIYVDDLLIFASKGEMEMLQKLLIAKFNNITMEISEDLSYLGMQLTRSNGNVYIGMNFYMEQLLKDWQPDTKCRSPGDKDAFVVHNESKLLCKAKRKIFHSMVARILYILKRVRLDIW